VRTQVTCIGRAVPGSFAGAVRAVWHRALAVEVHTAPESPVGPHLVTIVRHDVPMTAASMRLLVAEEYDFSAGGARVGDPVSFDGSTLVVATARGRQASAVIEAAAADAACYDGLASEAGAHVDTSALEMVATAAGVRREAMGGASLSRAAVSRCDALLENLTRSASCDDPVAAGEAAAALIGLGPGLTPSGDDALCGFMLGRRLGRGAVTEVDRVVRRVASSAAGRTTDVSAVQLVLAAQGRFGEALLGVATALEPDDSVSLSAAVGRCLGEGATSGADALLGLVAGAGTLWPERPAVSA